MVIFNIDVAAKRQRRRDFNVELASKLNDGCEKEQITLHWVASL